MPGRRKFLAPANFIVMDTGQIDGSPLSAGNGIDHQIVVLDFTDPHLLSSRLDFQLVPNPGGATGNAAGDDGSVPGDRKNAVDGHAKWRGRISQPAAGLDLVGDLGDGLPEFVQTSPRMGAGGHDRCVFQKRPLNVG